MQIDNKEKRKEEADRSPTRKTTTTTVIRCFLGSVHFKYIIIPAIILSVITFTFSIHRNLWIVSNADHFYIELFGAILSVIVGFYCMTRAYTFKEKFSLFVGVGFLTNAVIDFLHVALSYLNAGNTDFLVYFIPQTWFAGRSFLGAMLVIAVAKYAPKVWQQAKQQEKIAEEEKTSPINSRNNKGNTQNDKYRYDDSDDKVDNLPLAYSEEKLDRRVLLSLSILVFLAIFVVIISFSGPLTGYEFRFPAIVINLSPLFRPYEIPSLVLFSIALFLFYKKRLYNTNDAFYKGILAALIIDVFGQVTMAYSAINFHTAHNVAHVLKDAGYFMIVIALAVSSIQYNKIAKQSEATIRAQYNRLREMDKMKDEFINVAAHELRTPVQPIIGLTELLRSRMSNNVSGNNNNSSSSNAENQEFLDVIIRNGKRLEKLIEDVLDVTKIESQSLPMNKEHFDLNDLIISIIDDIVAADKESMAYDLVVRRKRKTNAKIIYQPRHLPIYADKNRIAQVISNLLDNAQKFTSEGSIVISTDKEIGNNRNNSAVTITVSDTGSGVDPEIMPRLFTKFSSKSFSGTGLGLYISKNIIEAHGGRIWAENNKDTKGATFSFSLPIPN